MRDAARAAARYGVVAIGRNEGERLRRCLESAARSARHLVYVDSGSTDASVAMARAAGAEVVVLDAGTPFTAARARNAGFARLRALAPALPYVQFVDGDCELVEGWMERAARFLDTHPDAAVACGRRRERFPERSIYNLLCDMEWDTPVGEARACGGDAMMRAAALEQVGGYRADLIAGEEPELCVRLRRAQWRVWRLDAEMTLHDAAMTRFSQWWMRTLRGGYAFAEGAHVHGALPERFCVREQRRARLWGLGIPLLAGALTLLAGPWGLALLALYPLQVARLALRGRRGARENWWQALFLVLGKFPEAIGNLKFLGSRAAGYRPGLIEYK